MPRGERIGDAYVRIHADGRGMNDDLRKDFDDLGDDFEKFGQEHSERYNKGFMEERKKQRKVLNRDIVGTFDEAIGKMTARVDRLTLPLQRSLEKRFKEAFGPDVGERLMGDFLKGVADGSRDLSDSGVFDGIAREASRIGKEISRETEKEWSDTLDDALKMNRDFDQQLREDRDRDFDNFTTDLARRAEAWSDMLDDAYRIHANFLKKQSEDRDREFEFEIKQMDEIVRANERMVKEERDGYKKLLEDIEALGEGVERLRTGTGHAGDSVKSFRRDLDRLRDGLHNVWLRNEEDVESFERSNRELVKMRQSLVTLTPRINKFEKAWFKVGDTLGDATGRGSRNNFLNFLGSLNRGIFNLTGRVVTSVPKATAMLKGLIDEFKDLRANGSSITDALQGVTGGLASSAKAGIPGLIATAAAIGAMVEFSGLLAAGLSGIVAGLVALAGALSFALIGSVAALGGAFVALAGGVGVAVLAFQNLDEETKGIIKDSLKPFTDEFKRLGEIAADITFKDIGEQIKSLEPVLDGLEPVIRKTSLAIRGVFQKLSTDIGNSAKDPNGGVSLFLKAMEHTIPKAMSDLSIAGASFLGGLGGVFRAIATPGGILDRFLDWIRRIAEEFNQWANSAAGQSSLISFFEKAGDAAADVGAFIGETTKALGELFAQASDEGGSIFRDLADKAKEFVDWLRSPEGKKAVDDWLEFGKNMAKSLGNLVLKAIELWDKLDNPTTRGLVLKFIDGISWGLGVAADAVDFFFLALEPVISLLGKMADLVITPREAFNGIKNAVTSIGDTIGGAWTSAISAVSDAIADVYVKIRNLPSPKDVFAIIKQSARDTLDYLGRLINRIPGVPNMKDAFATAKQTISDILGFLASLISRLPGVKEIPNPFKTAYDAAKALLGVINDILDKISNIHIPGAGGFGKAGGLLDGLNPFTASGGVFEGARGLGVTRRIGEAGPEAVVPLDRPLSMVDPSVRFLSALAQGMVPGAASGTVTGGRSVTVPEINVYSTADPRAVAQETLNLLVGQGY